MEYVYWFSNLVVKFADFLIFLILFTPRFLYNVLANILIYFLDFAYGFMPDFSMLFQQYNYLNNSPAGYFFDFFQLAFGLKLIIGAYFFRFFIRRIPVIG